MQAKQATVDPIINPMRLLNIIARMASVEKLRSPSDAFFEFCLNNLPSTDDKRDNRTRGREIRSLDIINEVTQT